MKALLPKIKFKNFDEKWNRKKLHSIAPLRGGFAFKSEKFQNTGIPIVRISNIKFDGTIGGEFEYYSKIISDEKFVLRGRSILLAMSGATTGKIAMLDSEEEYYQNQRVGYFQNTGEVDYDFLSSVLQTKAFTNQLNAVLVAGAQPNISSKEIDSFEFYIPDSIEEQSAIGYLLCTLDDLLSSYKDNLTNYQALKATMLSKMFPKDDQSVPEIRLDGFEDRWEERCIGELADIVRGASPRPIQDPKWFDSNSEIGWLRISDVTNQNGRIHSLEQKISKLGQEKTRVLTEPHLLLSIAATVGKPVVNYVKTGVHDGFLIFMNPKFDREFMFQWLEMFREKWNRYGQPGSQVNLNSDIVKNQKILIPSMEEQRAIGTYFLNLDNLISSNQEKISQLEILKKKLLQDMFI
ncbi:restriction endonuclease subunit S [uncultured Streptococcus sp.]|uniref:restriction endonuclease subunit S n=1 Tax=uncultured Streptococcus sp. TaxID=83427 RepID=UPI001A408A4A|nr:restriction endonuclease subunit S [uncultured Streptococcus sp.]VTY23219.1 Type I restriction modification DNA specificity domain protein [uncultured Streptococcus sp.]